MALFSTFVVEEATKTILFDMHSRVGLDFGILTAWAGVSIGIYPFATWFMYWRERQTGR